MKLVEQFETLNIEEAKSVVMQELSLRALRAASSISEGVEKVPGRYYIHDKSNNVVGNPKGYGTFKGANQQQNKPGSAAHKSIWDEFYRHEKEHGKENNLVSSIKLHEEIDTVEEATRPYGYHESNPKIDLHNKHSGEYIASTNYAQSVKQAVQKYEEKFPDMKGSVRGYLADKK
jgi:hypothetical protein